MKLASSLATPDTIQFIIAATVDDLQQCTDLWKGLLILLQGRESRVIVTATQGGKEGKEANAIMAYLGLGTGEMAVPKGAGSVEIRPTRTKEVTVNIGPLYATQGVMIPNDMVRLATQQAFKDMAIHYKPRYTTKEIKKAPSNSYTKKTVLDVKVIPVTTTVEKEPKWNAEQEKEIQRLNAEAAAKKKQEKERLRLFDSGSNRKTGKNQSMRAKIPRVLKDLKRRTTVTHRPPPRRKG